MGKLTVDGQEHANIVSQKDLDTDTGEGSATDAVALTGTFNLAIWGDGEGEVVLERSFNGGADWVAVTNLGVVVVFTGPCSELVLNREAGVLHRLRCRDLTSGIFTARLSN
ncbi:hypothetical protein [Polymorphobacter sp.]|uniref:hypothetical protein n=1 Tax=Polymorphobacter sp. TaxID=1909290 RepID=UPI003F717732